MTGSPKPIVIPRASSRESFVHARRQGHVKLLETTVADGPPNRSAENTGAKFGSLLRAQRRLARLMQDPPRPL